MNFARHGFNSCYKRLKGWGFAQDVCEFEAVYPFVRDCAYLGLVELKDEAYTAKRFSLVVYAGGFLYQATLKNTGDLTEFKHYKMEGILAHIPQANQAEMIRSILSAWNDSRTNVGNNGIKRFIKIIR